MQRIRQWRADAVILAIVIAAVALPWVWAKALRSLWGATESVADCRLIVAASTRDFFGAQAALREGASPEAGGCARLSPLISASANGDVEMVELLLRHGADANAAGPCENTALMFASMFDRDEVIRVLLRNGADANHRDDGGESALDRAIEYRAWHAAAELRQAGQVRPDKSLQLSWSD